MLTQRLQTMLNRQINQEFYSAYLYLSFANYFQSRGLEGFANWYQIQAQEERDHALLIYKYLHNNAAPVTLEAVAKPADPAQTDMEVIRATLAHEQTVTGLINEIYGAAYEERDFRTMQFLDWFVKEQGEEETNATDLIAKMELFGNDPKSLYLLNSEMATRTYAPPTLTL